MAGRCGLPRLKPAEDVELDEELLVSLLLCAALLTRSLLEERRMIKKWLNSAAKRTNTAAHTLAVSSTHKLTDEAGKVGVSCTSSTFYQKPQFTANKRAGGNDTFTSQPASK